MKKHFSNRELIILQKELENLIGRRISYLEPIVTQKGEISFKVFLVRRTNRSLDLPSIFENYPLNYEMMKKNKATDNRSLV